MGAVVQSLGCVNALVPALRVKMSRMVGRELQQAEIESRGRGPADKRDRLLTKTNIALM